MTIKLKKVEALCPIDSRRVSEPFKKQKTQSVHGSLFNNLPISLFSASYTFQQAKLLKAGKVVLYAVLRNVRKTFTYLLSGCFRMFFYEWQHSLLLSRQVLNGLLGSLLCSLLVALGSSPFWILKLKSRSNARSIIAELRRGESVILTSCDVSRYKRKSSQKTPTALFSSGAAWNRTRDTRIFSPLLYHSWFHWESLH